MASMAVVNLDEVAKNKPEKSHEFCENDRLVHVLDGFSDNEEVFSIIENLKKVSSDWHAMENSNDRFSSIMDKYQEQPHLLDPHLDRLLRVLVDTAVSSKNEPALMHQCFRFLYKITKTRHYKVVIRHLPHEVSDLEPVLALLTEQDPNDLTTWETKYVLLLWLSIIVMIPFHMTRLDGNRNLEGGRKPITERIFDVAKLYLNTKDKSMDAAGFLLSRFVVRPDVKELHLGNFIDWALDAITAFDGSVLSRVGELATITLLFKHGKREDLLPYAGNVLKKVLDKDFKSCGITSLRKLSIKLTQRIGMTFLKPRVTSWRYQRGSRSLEANLKGIGNSLSKVAPSEVESSHSDEDYDLPEDLELVIQELLNGLKDKETIIRWSAAKGVGRVTSRLPKELADEVVGSVLELFCPRETDSAWHGGCLALAEFGRRGFLLPERLPHVVLIILKALVYDEQKGSYSVGDHIRDAACYVCWAFARAYEPAVLLPYVDKIATALLITAVFDREVHCRRAASAAFQENVGRQGTFPHGIDIVTATDYFAVGNRNNAFLSVSVYIAQYPEYKKPLIDHLINMKISHWNTSIRELASLALRNLTVHAPKYMANDVLSNLVPMATGSDLNIRHGSILAIAEIFYGLAEYHSDQKTIDEIVGSDIILGVNNLVSNLQQRKMFRGLGGDLTRLSACRFIEQLSLAKLHLPTREIVDSWQHLIDDCLHHVETKVQTAAVAAFTPFCSQYYSGSYSDMCEGLVERHVRELDSSNESTRLGFSMAIGAIPKFILKQKLDVVIPALMRCTKITDTSVNWARSRQEAINALTSVCKTACIEDAGVDTTNLNLIFDCFIEGLNDYTIDSTGDIGAYVRTAAMIGIEALVTLAVRRDPGLISDDLITRIMCGIAQQAVEKIGNTRATATRIFASLLHSDPVIYNIPHRKELLQIVSKESCADIVWYSAAETQPMFSQLLALKTYTYSVLIGLSVSAGGLTESLVRDSLAALLTYIRSPEAKLQSERLRLCVTFVRLFRDHQTNTRVTLPLMNTIDRVLSSGSFDDVLEDPSSTFPIEVVDLVRKELVGCKDPAKIVSGVNVLCDLLHCSAECRERALSYLAVLMCHVYPRIRKDVTTKLFMAIVTYDDIVADPETLGKVTALLTETDWGNTNVPMLRPVRNAICQLLNIPEPKLIKK